MHAVCRSQVTLVAAASMLAAHLALPRSAWADADVGCPSPSNPKIALVIGNSYSGELRISGREDARAMAEVLCELGFSVLAPVLDGTAAKMKSGLDTLKASIAQAQVVVFFYSGHGYQLDDVNYLVPVGGDIDPATPEVSIKRVMLSLSAAPDSSPKFVFLDACRTDANLPVTGGRRLGDLPRWSEDLEEDPPSNAPPLTIFGYAAASGQTAASGSPDGLSPYTAALLRSIPEAGLGIERLFGKVHDDVLGMTRRRQTPTVKHAGFPAEFYFRPPVTIRIAIDEADDDLFVLLNGKVVRSRRGNNDAQTPVALQAGANELALMVYNQKSYRNGHSWEKTEGWRYAVSLLGEGGSRILCSVGGVDVPCFAGEEEVPFKDGPHHGQLFTVARAVLDVDRRTAALTLSKPDLEVWNREAPFEAQDQEVLDERNLQDIVKQVLGWELPILADTFAVVYGNRSLGFRVKECMNQPERREDFLGSALAAASGSPRPFDQFTARLVECVGVPVWTAFEDRG